MGLTPSAPAAQCLFAAKPYSFPPTPLPTQPPAALLGFVQALAIGQKGALTPFGYRQASAGLVLQEILKLEFVFSPIPPLLK